MKNVRAIIFLVSTALIVCCNRKPFVNAKLQTEKLANDCKDQQGYFKVVSSFFDERYEFEKCLPENFTKDQMTAMRKGDTVVLNFVKSTGEKNALYKITVDIDSYPKYHFVTVDDETFIVVLSKD